jgi:uncharacterized protein (DUF1697 family)
MPRCLAFLRAINVSGRFVRMETLAGHFREMGFADTQTFLASGNVVLTLAARAGASLEASLEAKLEARLGFRSEVFLRSVAEVRALADAASAWRRADAALVEVNVVFLKSPLDDEQSQALAALETADDALRVQGRDVLWGARQRQSESKLSNSVLERRLGQRVTLRRASMLERLAETVTTG